MLTALLILAACEGYLPKGQYGPSTGWAEADPQPSQPTPTPTTPDEPPARPSSKLSSLLGSDCEEGAELAEIPLDRACITADITCGQTVKGHTSGGSDLWDDKFYRGKFCDPADTDTYQGTERVYFLDTPIDHEVRISLDSPCKDLDLFMVTWSDPGTRSTAAHVLSSCEANTHPGGGEVMSQNIHNSYSYLVAVEGKHGEAAPFTLTVTCTDLREN